MKYRIYVTKVNGEEIPGGAREVSQILDNEISSSQDVRLQIRYDANGNRLHDPASGTPTETLYYSDEWGEDEEPGELEPAFLIIPAWIIHGLPFLLPLAFFDFYQRFLNGIYEFEILIRMEYKTIIEEESNANL